MIAPDIRMVDLEPDAFGWVCELAARAGRGGHELHLIHDAGRVIRAVDTDRGVLPRPWPELSADLAADARRLLAEHGVDRVVLVERAGLLQLAGPLSATGDPRADQPTMLRASTRSFWESPAIVTHPAPPADPWLELADLLASLASPSKAVAIGFQGERCVLAFEGTIVGGRLATVSSLPSASLSPAEAAAIVREAALGFAGQIDQLRAVVTAEDPWGALLALSGDDRTIAVAGLPPEKQPC